MSDRWKVTPALKGGEGRAVIVPVAELAEGAPVSLEDLGKRFGLHPDRLLSALLFDERNRLAAANVHRVGETTGQWSWNPAPTEAAIEGKLRDLRQAALKTERDAYGYLQLVKSPSFLRWQVVAFSTVYVPLNEQLAPTVKGGTFTLSTPALEFEDVTKRLEVVLDELALQADSAAKAIRSQVDHARSCRRELGLLGWADWVTYAMLRMRTTESHAVPRHVTDEEVEATREVRKRLRRYRERLEHHLLERPHEIVRKRTGLLEAAPKNLLKLLASSTNAELIGEVARRPELVPFATWWRLQSVLFRSLTVLADAEESVRAEAYDLVVAPALAVLAGAQTFSASDLEPLRGKLPGAAAAAEAAWPAATLGGSKPQGAFALALKNVSSWTSLAKKVGGLGSTTVTLIERWSGEMVARLAANAADRETIAGVFYKLSVASVDAPSSWRRDLAEALTEPDEARRMKRMLQEGKRAGLGLKAATTLMSITSLTLSLSDDPKVSLQNVTAVLSTVAGTGDLVEDIIAFLRNSDDADLFGFKTLGKMMGAVGVVVGAASVKGTYDKGDLTGGHLALAKTALGAIGLLVTGPLGAAIVVAELGLAYAEWIRDIQRGGAADAFVGLRQRLETGDMHTSVLLERARADERRLVQTLPYDLLDAAKDVDEAYFKAAWWDLTPSAGNDLLRAGLPEWVVRAAVGKSRWPASAPRYDVGERVYAKDHGTWTLTRVVRTWADGEQTPPTWSYVLKVRSASWLEPELAPVFEKRDDVKLDREGFMGLTIPTDATITSVDTDAGRYGVRVKTDPPTDEEVPFEEAAERLRRA